MQGGSACRGNAPCRRAGDCYAGQVIEVVCAVIRRNETILLCRRPRGRHLAGHWEFPGGKVEDREEARGALQREIREELGCEIEVGDPLPTVEHRYPQVSIRLQPFYCTVTSGEPAALEHEEIGWFRAEDIRRMGLAGADQEVFRAINPEE